MSIDRLEAFGIGSDRFSKYAYSPAIAIGNLLFVAGQSSVDDEGQTVGAGDFEAQGRQTFANLDRVLQAGGSSLADVAKVTVFLTDMRRLPDLVTLRRTYFSDPFPADSVVEVTALSRPELMIEIEAIALRRA